MTLFGVPIAVDDRHKGENTMERKPNVGVHESPLPRPRTTKEGGTPLGFALHTAENTDAYAATAAVTDLAKMCDQAADHIALAHNLIVAHESHTDTAIGHLDAALDCLQRLSAEGERRIRDTQSGGKQGTPTTNEPTFDLAS